MHSSVRVLMHLIHKTSLTLPIFIKVHVSGQKSERICICNRMRKSVISSSVVKSVHSNATLCT
jgi:hypothetical protein